MKKRILSLFAVFCAFFITTSGTNDTNNNNNGNESEITINASEIQDIKGTKGIISFTSAKGEASSDPKYIVPKTGSSHWTYYSGLKNTGNSMTIISSNSFKSITFKSKSNLSEFVHQWVTDSSGSSSMSGKVITWTSTSAITSVTFKNTGTADLYFVSFTVGDITDPTVSLTNASDSIGGYYKDGDTKKQFVSFGATVTALPEKDLSLVSEYGINIYSDPACSTLVTTKSATIGEGGHTIDELKGQGGRFYTILSSEDGIVDKTPYYAKAYVKESSGASVESSTAMTATADTGGIEYIL